MDTSEEKALKWAKNADDETIKDLAQKLTSKMVDQFPDFEPISCYFKRAVVETWPAAVDARLGQVMKRMQEVMQQHHEHILYLLYGNHGYADDVQELLYALTVSVYNRIAAISTDTRPEYTERWKECAAELGSEPEELVNSDYFKWMHAKIARKERERQAELMGVDPDTLDPYDYETWLMGNTGRRK